MSRIGLLLLLCANCYTIMAQTIVSNPSDCGLHIFIPDLNCAANGTNYNPVNIEIEIDNTPGVLGVDVYLSEVRLIIGHTWMNDLKLTLLSPSGVAVELMANNGGSEDNLGDPSDVLCMAYASFSIGACTAIGDGEAPFLTEPFRPYDHFYNLNDGITPANGDWRLLVCDDAVVDTGFVEFIQLVLSPIECLPISEIEVLNVDTTAVELEIMPTGFCGITIIEYGLPGFIPGIDSLADGGVVAVFNCEPIVLMGLFSDTEYEIYIRRYCETTGLFSPNSCPTNTTTGCQPPSITAIENFDNSPNCSGDCLTTCDLNNLWRNISDDDMDWLAHAGSTATIGTGPTDDITGGGKYVYIETSGCENNMEAILHSPCVALQKEGTDTCHLSFSYHMFGSSIGSLKLEVSEDGGFSWGLLWMKSGNQGSGWHKTYVGLGDYAEGSILQFRFIGKKIMNVKGDIALDEIIIYGSEVLDYPETVYYFDNDNDGYGNDDIYVLSCTDTPPVNYVLNGGDCDDNSEFLNPGIAEIPCDGLDNNCNGIEDDSILPSPLVTGDTICSGEQSVICATGFDGATLLWYNAAQDMLLDFDTDCYTPGLAENNTSVPIEYTFWVGQVKGACYTVDLAEATVVVNPSPAGSTSDTPAICPADSFNLASINIEDANFTGAAITFHTASPADNNNELTALVVSPIVTTTYYYLLTSPDGCTNEGQVDVIAKAGPNLSFEPSDSISLCQETLADIEVTAIGGTAPYTYFWNTGASTASISVEADFVPGTKDTYTVMVMDDEGCFSTDSIEITSINSIDSISLLVTDVSECMGGDGSIRIVPLNGLGPFDFYWTSSNGSSGNLLNIADTALITGLDQGVYQVEILDSSNDMCSFSLHSAIVQGPGVVILEPTISSVTCFEAADGEICLNIQGANDVHYLWNTADTTICINNLAGGVYAVTVSSGDCETVLDNLIVAEPDSLFGRCTMTWPTCFESTDGRIDIQMFGGTPPFEYEWSTTDQSPFILNQPSGIYFVTVTDGNDCMTIKEMFLPAPDELTVVIDSFQNISCSGEEDAFIQVIGNGGTAPYQYQWNTGSVSPVQVNLTTGVYIVTITDLQGCIATRNFIVNNPAILEVEELAKFLPICNGDFTGFVEVQGVGGTPPYTFFSSEGELVGTVLNGLGVGEYAFWVEDESGCVSDTLVVELNSLATLDFGMTIISPICVGPATGSIDLNPVGVGPFTYVWDNGGFTSLIENLIAGTYCVEVYDALGCRYDTCIALEAPQVFNVNFGIIAPSCFGVDDGVINTSFLLSGTAPFILEWNDGVFGANRTNLSPGNYQLSISDVNGCEYVSDTLVLDYPDSLHLEIEDFGSIPCYGDSSAYIETNITGGILPYTINWIGTGVVTEDIVDLAEGEYRLSITDSRLCIIDTTFIINEPSVLIPSVQILQGGICDPVVTGDTLWAAAVGGIAPYVFTWNTGSQSEMLTGIEPGDYSFTVEDAVGCTTILEDIKLRDRVGTLVLDTFFVKGVSCLGESDASMTAMISRGTGNYLYIFNPTHTLFTTEDSVTCENLSQGSYSVTVTDVISGCQVESEVIEPPSLLPLTITRDSFITIQCFGGAGGAIYIHAGGGTSPYTYAWFDEEDILISENEDLEVISAGTYTVVVEDAHGCLDTLIDMSVQDNNTPVEIDTFILTNVPCRNENTGNIDVLITGGVPPYLYEWSYQSSTTEDLIGIPAGVYNLTVTDDETCRVIFPPFQITQPSTSIAMADMLFYPNCFNTTDGSIIIEATGGGQPYMYFWYAEGTPITGNEDTLQNVGVGQYELVLVDTFECIRYDTFELTAPEMLQLTIELMTSDGLASASAMVVGGTAPYYYLWSTGDTTMQIENLEADTYYVTVTDGNGCQIEGTVLVVGNEDIYEQVNYVNLYPNPSSGQFKVEVQLKTHQFVQLEIFDVLGQKVEALGEANFIEGIFDLNLNGFPDGIYFVKLSVDGDFAALKRLVKY